MFYLTDTAGGGSLMEILKSITWQTLLPSLITLVLGFLVIKVVMRLFDKALQRTKLEKAAYSMIRGGFRILLYLILLLVVVSHLGVDVTSLVAILSVVSLAISLAVQGALTNLVGGISLLATHPFRSGDYVDIGSLSGTVKEVGLSYTVLETPDLKLVHIPNGTAASAQIVNYSTSENRRVDITVSVSYTSSAAAVREALLKAANVPQAMFTPEPFVGVSSYGDSAITYTLRFWVANENYWDAFYLANENIRTEFEKAGIAMTHPQLVSVQVEK